jgi:alpha-beta hydrolase superfamily lysophospholipase
MTARFLTTDDGVRISSRRWSASPDRDHGDAVVVVHGFTATKDAPEIVELAERLAADGHTVLTYDSRGHGASDGECTLGHDEIHDVAAVVADARSLADRVLVVGASMGAIAALRYGAIDPALAGVVLISCPSHWQVPRSLPGLLAVAITQTASGRRLALRRMGVRLATRLDRDRPPDQLVADVAAPLAIVHGRRDRFLPIRAAGRLFAAASEPRRMWVVEGMGHAYDRAGFGTIDAALEWCRTTSDASLADA